MKNTFKKVLSLVLVFTLVLPILCSPVPSIMLAEASDGSYAAEPDSSEGYLDGYATAGLVAFYDGINNTESGHDANSTVWEDLVGENDFTVTKSSASYFTDNGYLLNGERSVFPSAIKELVCSDEFSFEIALSDFKDVSGSSYSQIMGSANDNFSLFRHTGSSNVQFKCNSASATTAPRPTVSSHAFLYGDATLTVTYKKGGSWIIYVNGQRASSGNATLNIAADDLGIGNAVNAYKINMLYRAIRFYNRELTADEAASNYKKDSDVLYGALREKAVKESGYVAEGLVALYRGTKNTLKGHDLTATVWEDLVSGYNLPVTNSAESSHFTEAGYYLTASLHNFPQEIVDIVNGEEFTIELLLSDFESTGTTYNQLMSSANDNFSLFRNVSTNLLQFKCSSNSRPQISSAANVMSTDPLISITFKIDGRCVIYIDGVKASEVSVASLIGANSLRLGNSAPGYSFNALFESIRFYDRALSAEEIARNASSDGKIVYTKDGLVSLYSGNRNTSVGHNTASTVWEDLVGENDITVANNGDNYFTDDGYVRTTAKNYFPTEILDLIYTKDTDGTITLNSFTMEFLVKDFSVPSGSNYQNIVASSNDRFTIFRASTDNMLKLKYGYVAASISGADNRLSDLLLTVTYDASATKCIIYCNGFEVSSAKFTPSLFPDNLFMGYDNTPARAFGLTYRSMRFYNRAITADEVYYNATIDDMIDHSMLGYIEVAQPKTNIVGDIAIMREINSLSELEAMMAVSALPAAAVYAVDSNLNLLDDSGNAFTTLEDALEATNYTVIPVLIPVDTEAALAIADYCTDSGFTDLTVLSSDPAIVKAARDAKPTVRGAIDFRDTYSGKLTKEDRIEIRRILNSNMATIAMLPSGAVTNDDVQHLYEMQVSVWVDSPDATTAADCYDALLSGAVGVISDDTASLLDIACNKLPKNTATRLPMNVAHAGIPTKAPQNTIEGSLLAYELGASCIEMDLQLTSDGVLVAMHDLTTGSVCNENLTVAESTYEELSALYVNKGWENDPVYSKCRIPTLIDYFETFKDKDCHFFIELKNTNLYAADAVLELIEEYDLYDRCTIISFFNDILTRVRTLDPTMHVGLVNSSVVIDESDSELDMKSVMALSGKLNASYMLNYYETGCGESGLRASMIRGLPLYAYTFGGAISPCDNYYAWGYAGLTTNNTGALGDIPIKAEAQGRVMSVGGSVALNMILTSYNRTKSTVTPSNIEILSGDELVSLDGNILSAIGSGEVLLALGYTTTVGSKTVTYFDDPVTITITEKASESDNSFIKIIASNLEYADFLHILYAVSVNAPEGAEVGEVKMLFWSSVQGSYTKDNAEIIKGAYVNQSITMGGMTYDNCSLVRSADIAPKEICDDIYAVAYVTIDGVDYYSKVLRYSPLTYVYSRLYTLDNNTPATEAEIATAENQRHLYETILKYGAAAQKIFGYTENGLATDDYVFVSVRGGEFLDGFTTAVYAADEEITLIAKGGGSFVSWTDEDGNVLSTEAKYTFTPDRSITITANYTDAEDVVAVSYTGYTVSTLPVKKEEA